MRISRSKPATWLWIAATLALIVGGWFGTASIAPAGSTIHPAAGDWVRTRDGWERANWKGNAHYEPALHPLTVGSMFALAALWVMMVSQADPRR